ncbi:hypothetical protein TNCV_1416811 [Trichonephila clavipes]|nr:hypothetical protein TNCV_1416811 [Trichonephila clavipes]
MCMTLSLDMSVLPTRLQKIHEFKRQIYRLSAKGTDAPQLSGEANRFLAASGKQISRKTVARRLREETRRTQTCCVSHPDQTARGTARLQWCREHHNWSEQDWACVLFSDESRFSLSSVVKSQLIWREWYCLSSRKYQEKDRYPTCSIAWCGPAS